MDYQKSIKTGYFFESVGYALAASGIGAIIYGITKNNSESLVIGISGVVNGEVTGKALMPLAFTIGFLYTPKK